MKTTITPAAAVVQPMPCSLPDPESAFTLAQVRENLLEMEAQLDRYPVNLTGGPGWVRGQIMAMLDRGIVAGDGDGTEPLFEEIIRLRAENEALRGLASRFLLERVKHEAACQDVKGHAETLKDAAKRLYEDALAGYHSEQTLSIARLALGIEHAPKTL